MNLRHAFRAAVFVNAGLALFAVSAIRTLRRKLREDPASLPRPEVQLGLWSALVLAGLILGALLQWWTGLFLLLAAQALPRERRKKPAKIDANDAVL